MDAIIDCLESVGSVLDVEFGLGESLHIGHVFGLDAGEVGEQEKLAVVAVVTGSAVVDGGRGGARNSGEGRVVEGVIESLEGVIANFDVPGVFLQGLDIGPKERLIAGASLDVVVLGLSTSNAQVRGQHGSSSRAVFRRQVVLQDVVFQELQSIIVSFQHSVGLVDGRNIAVVHWLEAVRHLQRIVLVYWTG